MIVLDTHVLLWWVSGETERLSVAAAQAIDMELTDGQILVSSRIRLSQPVSTRESK